MKLFGIVFDTFAQNLKARHAVISENEPKLESAEPFAQGNLPVLKIIIITSYFNIFIIINLYTCHRPHPIISTALYFNDHILIPHHHKNLYACHGRHPNREGYHVVDGKPCVLVLKIERFHVESAME